MTENLDTNGGYSPNMNGVQLHEQQPAPKVIASPAQDPWGLPILPPLRTLLCGTTHAPTENPELLPSAGT